MLFIYSISHLTSVEEPPRRHEVRCTETISEKDKPKDVRTDLDSNQLHRIQIYYSRHFYGICK